MFRLREGESGPILTVMDILGKHEQRVLNTIDQDALLKSVCSLVSIPSLGGFETPAQEWVASLLSDIGLEVDVWELDFPSLSGHPGYSTEIDRDHGLGVVGRIGEGPNGTGLILNGHVDVVPPGHEDRWSAPAFEPRVSDGRIYGRGAVDMKAGLCSAIFAAKAIRDAGISLANPLFIESVIGEEDGGVGTLGAIVRGYRAQGAIVMEPTNLEIATTGAGCHNFRIRISGQAAHGALRSEGVSAIRNSWPVLTALEELEAERNAAGDASVPGDLPFPICVGKMWGGEWASSVAEEVVMEGRYGVRPGEDPTRARAELESAVAGAAEKTHWLCDHPPQVEWWGGRFEPARVDPNTGIAATVREAHQDVTGAEARLTGVPFGSDMGLMVNHGDTPCVLYGPGDVRCAHRPDEFVPIEEVVSATHVLALVAMRFCGVKE